MNLKQAGAGGMAGRAVAAALALFGGSQESAVSFAGIPYPTADSGQLRIDGEELGYGNCAPRPELFAAAEMLCRAACPDRDVPEEALSAGRFSFACGRGDLVATALQVIFALITKRDVRKYIITVKNAAERESIRHSLTALSAYFADVYGVEAPAITVYNSDFREDIRRFAASDSGHILLINRENFDKEINLFRRPYGPFSDISPLSLLSAGYPVVITIAHDSTELGRLTEHLPLFNPLCTLCFFANPDESGNTVPVFRYGSKAHRHAAEEDNPTQLQFT
ncbi:MAG: hypothetical protein E7658_01585 [Ruminococcaceae bacterium]|nr:hypothetical protein [Oscillospiraceae bacterium]